MIGNLGGDSSSKKVSIILRNQKQQSKKLMEIQEE